MLRVFTNCAITLDGKLLADNKKHGFFGSAEDQHRMSVLRSQADGILVGAETFRTFPYPCIEASKHFNDGLILRKNKLVVNAVLTRNGQIPRQGKFYEHPQTLPVILHCREDQTCSDFKSDFHERAQYHRFSEKLPLKAICEFLFSEYGVKNLLVEGGGMLIAQLLQEQLIDEMYVTLCPWIAGDAAAVSLVHGRGFLPHNKAQLALVSCEPVGAEIFLRYRVNK